MNLPLPISRSDIAATAAVGNATVRLGVPAEVYHRRELGVVTAGALKMLARSPAHYLAFTTGKAEEEESEALRFGRLLHMAALEPALFAASVVVEPTWGDRRYKDEKARYNRWKASVNGHETISEAERDKIIGMCASLMLHPITSRMLASGDHVREATVEWVDEATGLRCKCRPDLWRRGLLMLDIKTTKSAAPGRFAWTCREFDYDLAEAHYRAGAAALGEPCEYVFAAVEKDPPYAVAVYRIDDAAQEAARERRAALMRLLADCMQTGSWPAYSDGIETLTLPRRRA